MTLTPQPGRRDERLADERLREIPGAYWNFEPCKARRVRVIVGKSPRETWWCASLEGQERNAIEVDYHGHKFYLDDDADAIEKLTVGRGSPQYGHSSLPVASVIGATNVP